MSSSKKPRRYVLDKTYFVPMKHMREVIERIDSKNIHLIKNRICDINLYKLQQSRCNTFHYSKYARSNWIAMFTIACHKAVYSHDWDKLAFLLKKFPRWKFPTDLQGPFDYIYIRCLTLLLMYHPSSQAQGLLCEYLHMTWGCRTEEDKKAILKVLLTLPKKLMKPYLFKSSVQKEDNDVCDDK